MDRLDAQVGVEPDSRRPARSRQPASRSAWPSIPAGGETKGDRTHFEGGETQGDVRNKGGSNAIRRRVRGGHSAFRTRVSNARRARPRAPTRLTVRPLPRRFRWAYGSVNSPGLSPHRSFSRAFDTTSRVPESCMTLYLPRSRIRVHRFALLPPWKTRMHGFEVRSVVPDNSVWCLRNVPSGTSRPFRFRSREPMNWIIRCAVPGTSQNLPKHHILDALNIRFGAELPAGSEQTSPTLNGLTRLVSLSVSRKPWNVSELSSVKEDKSPDPVKDFR
jgi:hypothetical protein